jgi:hypothetical protein
MAALALDMQGAVRGFAQRLRVSELAASPACPPGGIPNFF